MFKPILGVVSCEGTVTGMSEPSHKPVMPHEPKSPLMRGSCTSAIGQKRKWRRQLWFHRGYPTADFKGFLQLS